MRKETVLLLVLAATLAGVAVLYSDLVRPSRTPCEVTAKTILQILNENYCDPTLGTFSWDEVFDKYWDAIAESEGGRDFTEIMYEALLSAGVSHLMYLPPEPDQRFARAFADGGVGLSVRWTGSAAIVTRVAPLSPAEAAGVHPGWEIVDIDGVLVGDIADGAASHRWPPLNDRKLRADIAGDVLVYTFGEPRTRVEITFDTPSGVLSLGMVRELRSGKSTAVEGMPPAFLELEARVLAGGIGYVRLNAFDPALTQRLLRAVDEMIDTPGLVIDLRGNTGGAFDVRKALIDKVVGRRALIALHQYRDESVYIYSEPVSDRYRGEVAILVDETSASAAEEVAGALQAIGRATVVGSRTQGSALIADWRELPNGGTLVFPIAVSRVYGGAILEGEGVTPDIEITLDTDSLLNGIDTQLEAAMECLQQMLSNQPGDDLPDQSTFWRLPCSVQSIRSFVGASVGKKVSSLRSASSRPRHADGNVVQA